ncbi:MAG: dimethyl sulfoxide reductase anchor subunit [Gemmatimonadales bacterium]|nr:MAG: dimethyl sulfoxide reductase anchor subunit [Gemmatimonadales bacterium]
MPRNGFQLDLNLCTGCAACVVACAIENELPWGTSWRWVDTFNAERLPGIPVHHLSLACNHCADAPCARACPAAAYSRDPATGAVLLDGEKCIGCRYCTWACPYDAPRFDAAEGVVSKCTFCNHRQREGKSPACVGQCPTGALRFGPVDELEGRPQVPGFPRAPADPAIRFLPLRPGTWVPSVDLPAERGEAGEELHPWRYEAQPIPQPAPEAKLSFAREWPLWFFTLTVSVLVGLMASPGGRATLGWPVFAAAAGLAVTASTLHLGRPERAWRAMLGWRTSWLSREILLFGAFAASGTALLAGAFGDLRVAGVPVWETGVALLGFATLFAMDRVYGVVHSREVGFHSARTLTTGLLVATLVAAPAPVWMTVVGYKLLLYGARKHRLAARGRPWGPRVSGIRVASSLSGAALLAGGIPASAILLGPGGGLSLVGTAPVTAVAGLVLLALGEALDRGEFYQELTVPTPARQVQEDLASVVAALT